MKLHHTLDLEVSNSVGLIALVIVATAIVAVAVALIVTRKPGGRQGGGAGGLTTASRARHPAICANFGRSSNRM